MKNVAPRLLFRRDALFSRGCARGSQLGGRGIALGLRVLQVRIERFDVFFGVGCRWQGGKCFTVRWRLLGKQDRREDKQQRGNQRSVMHSFVSWS
jgi:hypothetical protein